MLPRYYFLCANLGPRNRHFRKVQKARGDTEAQPEPCKQELGGPRGGVPVTLCPRASALSQRLPSRCACWDSGHC